MYSVFYSPNGPFAETPHLDMRTADRARLETLGDSPAVSLVNLATDGLTREEKLRLASIRHLSLRHFEGTNLELVNFFPQLETLSVWQSNSITSLHGIQALSALRWLNLEELGPYSLEPVSALQTIEVLFVGGGVWKYQQLTGSFRPLAALKRLRHLAILGVVGPTDLSPLLNFEKLDELMLTTAGFPIAEVARLAAAYPFWRTRQPWLQPIDRSVSTCSLCGETQVILLLKRKKRIWCQSCEAEPLKRILAKFDHLVDGCRSPK